MLVREEHDCRISISRRGRKEQEGRKLTADHESRGVLVPTSGVGGRTGVVAAMIGLNGGKEESRGEVRQIVDPHSCLATAVQLMQDVAVTEARAALVLREAGVWMLLLLLLKRDSILHPSDGDRRIPLDHRASDGQPLTNLH